MDKLLSDFRDSIFTDAFNSYGGDIIETGVDSLLGDGLLKDVPVINTIMGVIKTVLSIRERMFLKNTIVFLSSFNNGTAESDKVDAYKTKLSDDAQAPKEMERVVLLLNQYVDTIKSRYLALMYKKYVFGEYDWSKFCELSDILSRLFLEDILTIKEIYNSENHTAKYHILSIPYNVRRLESIGLVELYGTYARFGDRLLQAETMCAELTINGKILRGIINTESD